VVAVAVAVAVIVPLAIVPVAQTSSFSLTVCPQGDHNADFLSGTNISGNWREPDGSVVSFFVGQFGFGYSARGTNGSFHYVVNGTGSVDFSAGPTNPYASMCTSSAVQVTIHWTSPILWQLSGPD
jgi:hypothetical protein